MLCSGRFSRSSFSASDALRRLSQQQQQQHERSPARLYTHASAGGGGLGAAAATGAPATADASCFEGGSSQPGGGDDSSRAAAVGCSGEGALWRRITGPMRTPHTADKEAWTPSEGEACAGSDKLQRASRQESRRWVWQQQASSGSHAAAGGPATARRAETDPAAASRRGLRSLAERISALRPRSTAPAAAAGKLSLTAAAEDSGARHARSRSAPSWLAGCFFGGAQGENGVEVHGGCAVSDTVAEGGTLQ